MKKDRRYGMQVKRSRNEKEIKNGYERQKERA